MVCAIYCLIISNFMMTFMMTFNYTSNSTSSMVMILKVALIKLSNLYLFVHFVIIYLHVIVGKQTKWVNSI